MKNTLEEIEQLNISLSDTENDLINYINLEKKIEPQREAFKNAWIYGVFGILWVTITDNLIHFMVTDIKIDRKFDVYKGWFFVLLTMILVYLLVKKVLVSYKKITLDIINAHKKLNTYHKTLLDAKMILFKNYNEIEQQRNELHHLAYFNTLSKLPNQAGFELKATCIMNDILYLNNKMLLLFIDINNFKYVNNSLGRHIGDKVLWYTANILKNEVQDPNIVAHLGGDDFAILYTNILDERDIINKINEIQALFCEPWVLENQEIFISVSIGAAVYPDNGQDLLTLFKNAEIAMYYTKNDQDNLYSIYSDKIANESLELTWMTNELRKAIRNKELTSYYQPLIDLRTGQISSVEVLCRWNHQDKGWISPKEFIPIAEKSGLIYDIDKYVFTEACKQMKLFIKKGYAGIKMSVNFSSKTLLSRNIAADIKRIIDYYELNCSNVQVEITETVAIADLDSTISVLNQLKSFGMKVALDDFGTGYSSLNYLKVLPIDIIKLDAGFIKSVHDENQEEEIIRTIIQLGHILNCKIVAEGIEILEQLNFLLKHKCDIGQGYLFSQPLPAKEFETYLKSCNGYF